MNQLKLYHTPETPSFRILWLLEELGAEYDLANVADAYSGETDGSSDNPHPHGYTPALVHNGQVVTESGAIALYLTDLFPESTLGVPIGNVDRGAYVTWLFYQVGVAEPLFYMKGKNTICNDASMSHLFSGMMEHIHSNLEKQPYLMGERFTAADILYMGLFELVRPILGEDGVLDSYLARGDRPARHRALRRENV